MTKSILQVGIGENLERTRNTLYQETHDIHHTIINDKFPAFQTVTRVLRVDAVSEKASRDFVRKVYIDSSSSNQSHGSFLAMISLALPQRSRLLSRILQQQRRVLIRLDSIVQEDRPANKCIVAKVLRSVVKSEHPGMLQWETENATPVSV